MNTRYLFRGKRIDNGEWLQGSLLSCKRMTIGGSRTKEDLFEHHIAPWDYDGFELVDPATISQCTGLKDKNGKLIYEGDIVDIPQCGRIPVIFKAGCFGGEQCDMGFAPFLDSIWGCGGEIIGNIHDTPSLLSETA